MKMTATGWLRLLTVVSLLCHQTAEPVAEKLFFKNETPPGAEGSRRTVRVGEDVVLECEAAGRPSPTIYWQHRGHRLNTPVSSYHIITYQII